MSARRTRRNADIYTLSEKGCSEPPVEAQGPRTNHRSTWTTSHEPIGIEDATQNPNAKEVFDKRVGQVGKSSSLGLQKSLPSQKAVQQAKKDGRLVHFASVMDLCHLNLLSLRDISQKTQREGRARRHNLRETTVDTEQCSRSKEDQLQRVQQQRSWKQFLDSLGMAGEAKDAVSAYWQVHMTRGTPHSLFKHIACFQLHDSSKLFSECHVALFLS